jgi:hypothetical protein
MNNRIEEIMYSAGLTASGCWDQMDEYDRAAIEKFAELIIRECGEWCGHDHEGVIAMFKHFGVER